MDPRIEELISWLNTYSPQALENGGEEQIRASMTYDDAIATAVASDPFAGMAIESQLQTGWESTLPPTDAQRKEAADYIASNPEFIEGSSFEGKSVVDMTDAEFKSFQAASFIAGIGFETIGDVEEQTGTDLIEPEEATEFITEGFTPERREEKRERDILEAENIIDARTRASTTLSALGVPLGVLESVLDSPEWQPYVVEAWEVDRGGISDTQIEANRMVAQFYRGTFQMSPDYGDPMNNPYRYGEKYNPYTGEIVESPGMGQVGNINEWLVDNAGMGGLPMVNRADMERLQFRDVGGQTDTMSAAQARISGWGPESRNYYGGIVSQIAGYEVGVSDSITMLEVMDEAFSIARRSGMTVDQTLQALAVRAKKQERPRGGSSRRFTVPYSLRTIPDYDSLANEADEAFRRKMGRRAQDYEMGLMTDHLGEMYGERNEVLIKAAKKSFNEGAMSFDVAAAAREFEAPDPAQTKQRFIEENWAKEIARRETAGQSQDVNRLVLNSIIGGTGMVGNV